jgi:hypothetical protein
MDWILARPGCPRSAPSPMSNLALAEAREEAGLIECQVLLAMAIA